MAVDETNKKKSRKYNFKRFKQIRTNIQKKVIDNSLTTGIFTLAGTWTKTLINGIQRGTDETNIIAREGLMHSVFFRGQIAPGSSMTGVGLIRIAIIYDRQPNASTFVTLDCFKEDSFRTIQNLDNRKRFYIIHDEVHRLSGAALGDGYGTVSVYSYHKIMKMMELNTNNAGTIADFTKGALYFCSVASPDFAVAAPVANIYTRVRFTDNNDYIKNVSNRIIGTGKTYRRSYMTPSRSWADAITNI